MTDNKTLKRGQRGESLRKVGSGRKKRRGGFKVKHNLKQEKIKVNKPATNKTEIQYCLWKSEDYMIAFQKPCQKDSEIKYLKY